MSEVKSIILFDWGVMAEPDVYLVQGKDKNKKLTEIIDEFSKKYLQRGNKQKFETMKDCVYGIELRNGHRRYVKPSIKIKKLLFSRTIIDGNDGNELVDVCNIYVAPQIKAKETTIVSSIEKNLYTWAFTGISRKA